MANKQSTASRAGMGRMARKSGRASCSSHHNFVAHPFLRSALALCGVCMSMCRRCEGGGGGPIPSPTPSPTHVQAPHGGGLVEGVAADGEGLVVGEDVGGGVWQAAKLGEGHGGKEKYEQGNKQTWK